MMKTVLKVMLPLLIIALGVGFAVRMVKTRPKAKRAQPLATAMLVDVISVRATNHQVVVQATGSVVPERTVLPQPEISGVIRTEAVGFEVGRRFKKGERIVQLDDRDLRLAIKQRKAAVTTAQFELTLEQGRAHVAKQEWTLLSGKVKTTSAGRALALRQPQRVAANARIAQAQAALEQARLNLTRTDVVAPFDCVVRDKRATLGQVVSPAAPIASLVGTDRFFVNVSVPVARLAAIAIPGLNGDVGADVTVTQQAGVSAARKGKVVRLLTDLDPDGRMARLVVAVDRPLDAPTATEVSPRPIETGDAKAATAWLPLLIGAYVHAEITAKSLSNVVAVPRLALHEGDRVWVAKDGKLDIRAVHIVWRERDRVLVDSGLADGEQLVVSPIPSPQPGMGLRLKGAPQKATSDTKPDKPSDKPSDQAADTANPAKSARADAATEARP